MTNEEVISDTGKFIDYIQANGERVLALAVVTDDAKVFFGNAEMLNEMALSLLAYNLGLKVVPK